jgi:hypothetical protein
VKARPLLSETSERDEEAERALLSVLPSLKKIWSERIHALMKARIEAIEQHWAAVLESAHEQIGQAIVSEVRYKSQLKRLESKVEEQKLKLKHPPPNWGEVLRFTEDEIEAAYKRQAKQHHPDKGGAPEKMKEINAARERALKSCEDRATVPEHIPTEDGEKRP